MENAATNLQDKAYYLIKNKILRAEYQPGNKISEKSIETDVQIGRTPVREALLHLRRDGLIKVIPQSGTFIALIDTHAALEAQFVRENIEKSIIMDSCGKISDHQAQILEDILNVQHRVLAKHDIEGFFESDERFHKMFYEITDKNLVWNWLQTLNIQLNRFRWLRLKVVDLNWDLLEQQHVQIFEAVKNNQPQQAGNLISAHLRLMLQEQTQLFQTFPEYFANK